MSYCNKKQLEAIRPTVTGIGWANNRQGAIYTGVSHRTFCNLIATGKIKHSRMGNHETRVLYSDIDEYMLSLRNESIDVEALTQKALRKIGIVSKRRFKKA